MPDPSPKSSPQPSSKPSAKSEAKASSTPTRPQLPIPLSLQWTIPLIDQAEQAMVTAPVESIIQWAFPAIQSFGLTQPNKVVADDLAGLAAKVRGALMTDGNTLFRPTIRHTMPYLLIHSQAFSIDLRMFLQATVRLVVPEVLAAIAHAQINKIAAREEGDAS